MREEERGGRENRDCAAAERKSRSDSSDIVSGQEKEVLSIILTSNCLNMRMTRGRGRDGTIIDEE